MQSVHFLEYTDVLLDFCRRCEGFWLDGGELDRINEELNKIMDVEGPGFSDFIDEIHRPYWRKRIRELQSSEAPESEPEPVPEETHPLPPLKEATFLESTYLECPACDRHLNRFEAFGIQHEACPGCHGMWLKQDELRQLKDRAEGPDWNALRWVDDEIEALETARGMPSHRQCPDCPNQKMASVEFGFSDVLLDFCPKCRGTWLDEGEFFSVMEYLKKQLADLSTDEALDRLKHELKELIDGPEGTLSELQDARAAAGTLLNVYLLNHPKLFNLLSGTSSLFS